MSKLMGKDVDARQDLEGDHVWLSQGNDGLKETNGPTKNGILLILTN